MVIDYNRYDRWLNHNTPDVAALTNLLTPYPVDKLVVYPVSPPRQPSKC